MAEDRLEVILGLDTHADTHTAVVIDELGRVLGTLTIGTTPAGFGRLVRWLAASATCVAPGSRGPAPTAPGSPDSSRPRA